MAVTIGVPRETFPGERRVALIPRACEALGKIGASVLVEESAGVEAGFPDDLYKARGASVTSRAEIFAKSDIIVQVRSLGANPDAGRADLSLLRSGQILIGFGEPLTAAREIPDLARTGVSYFAMELMPRITRAQSMDALSSMATIAGYRAVLLAATTLPKMFPMLMTAAGTVTAARVFILGAGVAGLQAIASARRLGAVVSAYDIRTAVKEQIESLGAKFVVLNIEAGASEDKGGYAKAMGKNLPQAARATHRSDPGARRRHHHRRGSGPESAHSGYRRDGQRAAARVGHRRYRRRTRRQLRADASRPDRGPQRHQHPGPAQHSIHHPVSRQPNVRLQCRVVLEADGQ